MAHMHIQVIAESEDLFVQEEVHRVIQKLLQKGETVTFKSSKHFPASLFKRMPEIILVSVFRYKVGVENPHFLVQVQDDESCGFPPSCTAVPNISSCRQEYPGLYNNMLCWPRKESTKMLTSLLVNLLGYRPVCLKGITVRDRKGSKIKPVVEVFVPVVPCFVIEEDLVLDKGSAKAKEDGRSRQFEDMGQICVVSSKILSSLLEEHDLTFYNQSGHYMLLLRERQVVIVRKAATTQHFLVESIYQGEALRKLCSLLHEEEVKGADRIKDAVLYPFDEEIDSVFYTELARMIKERNKKTLCFLHNLVCMCPMFVDHRAGYVKRIEEALLSAREAKEGRESTCEKSSGTEYLRVRREMNVDRVSVCTLKDFYRKML